MSYRKQRNRCTKLMNFEIISIILASLFMVIAGLSCSSGATTINTQVSAPTSTNLAADITAPTTASWSVYKAPGTETTAPPATNPPKTTAVTPNPSFYKVTGIYVQYYEIATNGIIQLNVKPFDRDGNLVTLEGPFDIKVWTTKYSGQPTESTGIIQEWNNIIVALTDYKPGEGVNLSLLYPGGFLDYYDDPGYIEVTLTNQGGISISGQEHFDNLQPVL
jgi:hypothetical protein